MSAHPFYGVGADDARVGDAAPVASVGAHTPGPWAFGHAGQCALWVGPAYDCTPVTLVPWDTDDARDNACDDARLIASAPELLAVLQAIVKNTSVGKRGQTVSFRSGFGNYPAKHYHAAVAAIAKATS